MKIAIIPARGGSKRIPRKNIKLFHGKPMLSWSIEAAQKSGCFDRIAVSSDDTEILDIALSHGATDIVLRPQELSDDFTPTQPVVQHAIDWYTSQKIIPSSVCCIYATAPFIRAADLKSGLDKLTQSNSEFAVSVTSYPFPIQRALSLDKDEKIRMVQAEHRLTRSQDLPEMYHDAGQFYWGTCETWKLCSQIFGENTVPVVVPRRYVQDIDTLEDWECALAMFETLKNISDAPTN